MMRSFQLGARWTGLFLLALLWPMLTVAEALRGVPFSELAISDAFWAPRIETNRVVTIPHLLRELEKQGSLGGFRILAGDTSTKYHGYMWGDSDVYKTLEGMVATLSLRPDPTRMQTMGQIIGSIAAAHAPDGYLFPHLQITEPAYRHFADETSRTCESYSLGHLIESAAVHYQLTRRTNYLAVARKAAELMRRTHAGGELLRVSGHPEVELALIKLYEVTGETDWLDLAVSFIENARRVNTAWSQGRPPLAGDEAQGHAVAMLYLYAATTDVARLKGDPELADLMRRKWTNVVGRKLYLTGGLGHSRHSEGFAADYDLPNDIAYAETCAAIANVFWQYRLFLASGDAAYLDVLERSLYNNVLAGVSFSGDRFFYVNPLATDGRRKFNQGLAERFAWTGCPCCPVNLVRLIPRVGDYFYAVQGEEVFVNLYAAGQARIRVTRGELVLRQATRYPWEGQVTIEILAAPRHEIGLHLRLPGWARGIPLPTDLYRYADSSAKPIEVRLNGQPMSFTEKQGFARLPRVWSAGDRVELHLPMPVRRVLAHPQVKENAHGVALERGPLVYCVEGADHSGPVQNLVLPDEAQLTATNRPDLLGGVTVIEAAGQHVLLENLRRAEPVRLKFIPYYAWNHRGPRAMAVWLPRSTNTARLPYDTSKWVGANYATNLPREATLTNDLISVRLYLPDAAAGFYRGTRFDWSGVIGGLDYAGHDYYPQWFQRSDPGVHDFIYEGDDIVAGPCTAITGPAEEFSTRGQGLGFDEAQAGGTFIKIGVGVLCKPDDQKYDPYRLYPIADGGRWTVTPKTDRIEFKHELTDPATGYAYEYRKVVSVMGRQPVVVLEHVLRNTGKRAIQSSVYNHNFQYLDRQAPGPGVSITFPFRIRTSQPPIGGLVEIRGNRLDFTKTLAGQDRVYLDLQGFGADPKEYDFRIENRTVGAGVRITADRPLSRLALWAIRAPLSLEPFIDMHIQPGAEFTWRIQYEYYTVPQGDK